MSVPIVRTVKELRALVAGWRAGGLRVGIVPTMGALHEGHLSLVRRALQETDRVVVTLFVNPRQFNNAADLVAYPRTEHDDAAKLGPTGAHLLYAPDAAEIYPEGLRHHRLGRRHYRRPLRRFSSRPFRRRRHRGRKALPAERGRSRLLRGEGFPAAPCRPPNGARPGYSDPDRAAAKRCARRTAWRCHPAMSGCRRPSAGSRRNLPPPWSTRRSEIAAGSPAAPVLATARATILAAGFRDVEYLELRSEDELRPLDSASVPARLLAAAWLGGTRLIDNVKVPAVGRRLKDAQRGLALKCVFPGNGVTTEVPDALAPLRLAAFRDDGLIGQPPAAKVSFKGNCTTPRPAPSAGRARRAPRAA